MAESAEAEIAETSVFGNLRIDFDTFSVTVDGNPVSLTYFEFELLRILCSQADRIINYHVMSQMLWHSEGPTERRRLTVAICRLRTKLAKSRPYRVETVRGRGYGFIKTTTAHLTEMQRPQ